MRGVLVLIAPTVMLIPEISVLLPIDSVTVMVGHEMPATWGNCLLLDIVITFFICYNNNCEEKSDNTFHRARGA